MAEETNGNKTSIDAKAEGLVNAYHFLYNTIGPHGERIDPSNIRKMYSTLISDGFKPVTHDRQPHFTREDIARIGREYGLRYDDRPRPSQPYGGATECSSDTYPLRA